jgi:hypothetical protein
MRPKVLSHQFVYSFPEVLEEATLYVSIEFATAAHLCCCGCGQEVITPFSPTDWRMIFNGEAISLEPSIGNWSFPCRSHYFLKRNKVVWASNMLPEDIEAGRAFDRAAKAMQYAAEPTVTEVARIDVHLETPSPIHKPISRRTGLWTKLKKWISLLK